MRNWTLIIANTKRAKAHADDTIHATYFLEARQGLSQLGTSLKFPNIQLSRYLA